MSDSSAKDKMLAANDSPQQQARESSLKCAESLPQVLAESSSVIGKESGRVFNTVHLSFSMYKTLINILLLQNAHEWPGLRLLENKCVAFYLKPVLHWPC